MDFIKKIWIVLVRLLSPSKPVGGLEISDTALRFLEFHGDKPAYASLRLPPGIIEFGKVKDRASFIEALRALHGQITSDPKKTVDTIVTIPANDVYVQAVAITKVAEADLAEAADLNLRMISPIDISTAYYSWQRILGNGANQDEHSQIELLGAFVPRVIVDEFVSAIREAGYSVAAVEFSTLSLTRSIFASKLLKYDLPYLAIHIHPTGIYFIILRNHSLIFNYFAPWGAAQGEERVISVESAKNLVVLETQRVFNFYTSHWGGQIKNVAIIASTLGPELAAAITSRFSDVEIEVVGGEAATSVHGAALRGLIPRVRDFDISLTSVSVHEAFHAEQILKFLGLWRSITITVFAALLLLFVGSDIYLRNIAARVAVSSGANIKQPDVTEYTALKAQADEFNKLVKLVANAKAGEHKTAWLIDELGKIAANGNVTIDRMYIQSPDQPVILVAEAASEQSAVDFKNKLGAVKQLSQVNFPLSGITAKPDGSIAFTITFSVTSWNP
jgi:hypothetical protein